MPSDPAVTEEAGASRYPFIPLSKALERAQALRKSAGDHAAPVSELPQMWGYAAKASGWRQTVAALKYYGLITDFGSKDRREVRLTEDARRYFLDERPEVHQELARKFALAPRAFAALWEEWKSSPPSDNIARSQLKLKFSYPENSAPLVLSIYKANLSFAKLTEVTDDSRGAGIAAAARPHERPMSPPPETATVKVGDYVQWTSNGQDQFPEAQRINWLSEDGSYARVFGSMTAIPTSELTVVDAPKPPPVGAGQQQKAGNKGALDGDLNVLLRGNRLEITADLDREGIKRLKDVLTKYEEILELLEPRGVA